MIPQTTMKAGRNVGDASQHVDERAACLIGTHTSFRSRERSPEGMTLHDPNARQHPKFVRNMAKPTNCDDGDRSMLVVAFRRSVVAAAAQNCRLVIFSAAPQLKTTSKTATDGTERRFDPPPHGSTRHRRRPPQLPFDSVNGPPR